MSTRDFHHPYVPYSIQLQFMEELYAAIEDGCVAILESPTGTGKSLSLICGALTWLRDHRGKDLEQQLKADENGSDEPEWVRKHAQEEKKNRILRERAELEARLKKIREKEQRDKQRADQETRNPKKQRRVEVVIEGEDDDDSRFVLDDYDSDQETGSSKPAGGSSDDFSPEVKELMKKLGIAAPGTLLRQDDADMELPDETKIFFCSRTHSQLSQFVHELRRVDMPPSYPTDDLESATEQVKHLSLGSRKNLCINPKVTKLNSATAINERCLEMQQSGKSEETRCEFLPAKDDKVLARDFRDYALAGIRDIEDLANLGKKMGVCPYYSSRAAIKPSEIVTLPYPLLLQKSAREALDISLKGHVVIIDEAHNLMDAISSIHSITVSLSQLHRCTKQLEFYHGKFKNRLKGSNKVYLMQVTRLLQSLTKYLEMLDAKGGAKEGNIVPGDLLSFQGMDLINFRKLQKYLSESKLARKLESYIVYTKEKHEETLRRRGVDRKETKPKDAIPVLTHLQGFLMALTNPSSEGKIYYTRTDDNEICFKYMLLDPAFHFQEIVESARAVILAGGTMQPMEDYMTHLFPYVPTEKIRTLSCGHVIPKENLLAWPLVKAQSGQDFDFTYQKRMEPSMVVDLGKAIGNLCAVIPHGVVCFFPSYSYLDFVISQWQKKPPDGGATIWEKLSNLKTIYQESSEKSSVEETLSEYGQSIDSGKGALLLSVVGGKMSEGINFNDNLGRAVIMVGLPFPNIKSAEWEAKLRHVEDVAYNSYTPTAADEGVAPAALESRKREHSKTAGRQFYENACMRAVNQSIGRAIRHREDYASIILVDRRYASARIQGKLPAWIREGMQSVDVSKGEGRVVDVMKSCARFFREKKAQGK